MDATLDELRQLVVEGRRLSSLKSKSVKSVMQKARKGLAQYTKDHPENAEAWRLRALAEDTLFQHGAALKSLEKSMAFSPLRDRKILVWMAGLKQAAARWKNLMLTPDQLDQLGNFLDAQLGKEACDHSTRFTRRWLEEQGIRKAESVLKAIQSYGGCCDCEVLANVAED